MQHSAIFKLKIKQQALRKLLTFSYVSTTRVVYTNLSRMPRFEKANYL